MTDLMEQLLKADQDTQNDIANAVIDRLVETTKMDRAEAYRIVSMVHALVDFTPKMQATEIKLKTE